MDSIKELLIKLFRENVKGKKPDVSEKNVGHDGKVGNWLEEQFGKHPDSDNVADFYGYELKSETKSKTTFGDWSANRYIFRTGQYTNLFKDQSIGTPQDIFCMFFGQPNPEKNNRCSWSGKPIPHLNEYNSFG
ncbi:MvaI/BcnI restriction endonuclease family protein [Mycoplasma sp. ES3157-GEN-MYC]|nr:MvaI/BcnI restriction endonuclease family protein [Mycoplasma miroungigenitalium]MBU4691593.1 MvaI/BcnI restriction endonuclease family protein [Mycoplasma miroungigenitalium]